MSRLNLNYYFKRTARLYSLPSFKEGFARIIDISGNYSIYNFNKTENQADMWSIYSDWAAVADDLSVTVGKISPK